MEGKKGERPVLNKKDMITVHGIQNVTNEIYAV